MKVLSSLVATLSFLFLLTLPTSQAQDLDTVTIEGRVVDQNSAIIPGAEIQATLLKTGATRTVTTDADGRYKLIQLPPGAYILRASCTGFATHEEKSVVSSSGQTLSLNFVLTPAAIQVETIVVTTSAGTPVDMKRTVVGATLNVRETDSLPLPTRSPLDLLFLLPGVTEEPLSTRDLAEDRNTNPNQTPEEAGTFSLSGAPAYSNNLTIDGLDNNDDRAARERFQPSVAAVEEVQVITNQFSAEYGRASGGRVNLLTRSGTQQLRGRIFYFFADESLNANTFRNNTLGLSRLPLQEHDGGFTIGGPIPGANPRTFFFASYERDQVLDSALIDTLVPATQNPLFPLPLPTFPSKSRLEEVNPPAVATEVAPFVSSVSTPLRNSSILVRLDRQFGETNNASLVYQGGRLANLRQFSGGNRLADALQGQARNSDAISLSDTQVFSASVVNQVRFQSSRLAPAFQSRGDDTPVVLITLNDSLLEGDAARRAGTLVAGSSTSGSTERREDRLQLQDIVSLVKGNHSPKFGVDVQRVSSRYSDLTDKTGTYNFASGGDFLLGIPSRFRQNFQAVSIQNNTYAGMFIQDDWQLLPQLLVSYGLRYERESILADQNNFGPRASMAYGPLSSGRLVIRAGAGIFYNRALLRTIDDFTIGKQQLFFDTNRLVDPASGKLMTAAQRRTFIATNIHFPQTLLPGSTLVKQFGELNTNFSRRLNSQLRIPESYQANLGAEYYAGRGYSLETNYTFTRGLHLWREFNVNAPVLPAGYRNFSEFLASRDFPNFVSPTTATRPLFNSTSAGELVRFSFAGPSNISRVVEFGVPVSVFNLSSVNSTTALEVALAALNTLRPDPRQAEIEELISAGNSFYRGLTLELRRDISPGFAGAWFSFRAGYTWSHLVDDGIVNTSDALVPGDFRAERARSLLDRRHRFVFSGTFALPRVFLKLQLSPVVRLASGAPFNISIGGVDRNLDDVGNDRPNFAGDAKLLHWQKPGQNIDQSVVALFSLPLLGQAGNLPRNAGHGPGLFSFDLNVTREFQLSERIRVRPSVEFDNVLNKTVFSFGSEFINFNAISPNASAEQRQTFLDSFLVATRTMRPRQIRLGFRLEF
ncbi:MAG TPA: carboxypeptidase regulatory-like domain-containing protein [Pyrinomonadaceae bacterium]|nr:carboxypeptidase regulatory-like domain-containing protein [Pyrinomonadaceae bacterium]